MPGTLRLTVEMPPDWDAVEHARRSVTGLLSGRPQADLAGMVAAELLENAVKYGSASEALELRVTDSEDALQVEVLNTPGADAGHLTRLQGCLGRLAAFESTTEAYLQVLSEVAERLSTDPAAHSGGVGLVRIAYEANTKIVATTDPNGRVHVVVRWYREKDGCHSDLATSI